MKKVLAAAIALMAVLGANAAVANEVPYWLHSQAFEAHDPVRKAHSISVAEIDNYVNTEEASTGVTWKVQPCHGPALCLDVVHLKGTSRPLDVVRGIWIVGRMVSEDFPEMDLVDGDKVVYRIDWKRIREVGKAFVWKEEGNGQNPIHLNRMFVDSLRNADGSHAAHPMNGSLMGDTMIAIKFMTDELTPKFALSAL